MPAEELEPTSDPHALTTLHVRRAVLGDPQGLDWIVRHLSPWLLAAARYRLGPELRSLYDPEDLVEDVWTVLLPRLPDLRAREERLTPVLLKFLSTTLAQRANRLLERHILGKPLREDPVDTAGQPDLNRLADPTSGIVSRAVRAEERASLLAAIEELPEQDRQVLLLRGVEQAPTELVAAELGIPQGTVAVRYHRARQRLRDRFPSSAIAELDEEPV